MVNRLTFLLMDIYIVIYRNLWQLFRYVSFILHYVQNIHLASGCATNSSVGKAPKSFFNCTTASARSASPLLSSNACCNSDNGAVAPGNCPRIGVWRFGGKSLGISGVRNFWCLDLNVLKVGLFETVWSLQQGSTELLLDGEKLVFEIKKKEPITSKRIFKCYIATTNCWDSPLPLPVSVLTVAIPWEIQVYCFPPFPQPWNLGGSNFQKHSNKRTRTKTKTYMFLKRTACSQGKILQ